jgi:hypothetical protein
MIVEVVVEGVLPAPASVIGVKVALVKVAISMTPCSGATLSALRHENPSTVPQANGRILGQQHRHRKVATEPTVPEFHILVRGAGSPPYSSRGVNR